MASGKRLGGKAAPCVPHAAIRLWSTYGNLLMPVEEYVQPIPEYAGKVPALPPVRTIEPDTYIGPTEESNWVLM